MVSARRRSVSRRPEFSVVVFALLLAGIALMGGSSRVDSLAQTGVRLAGIGALTALLVKNRSIAEFIPIRFLLAFAALIAIQLIPLPPSWWSQLPGRRLFAAGDALLGLSIWRPISLAPDLTLDALLSMIPVIAIVVAYGALPTDARRTAVPAICIVIATSALLGAAQLAGGPASPLRYYALHGDGAVGLFANRNHAGLLLALGIPALACWFDLHRPDGNAGARGAMAGGAAIILTILLLLNGSRAGLMLGLAGIPVAAAMLLLKRRDRLSPRLFRWGAGAGVLVLAIAGATMLFRPTVLGRLADIGVADDLRSALGPVLWQMVASYFPAGSGFGTFSNAYAVFEPMQQLRFEYVNAAHNDWAQLLVEGGLAGGLFMAVFLIWWLRATLKLWLPGVEGKDPARLLGWTISAFVMLASFVDYPMRTPLIACLFALGCCMMMAPGARARKPGEGHAALPQS